MEPTGFNISHDVLVENWNKDGHQDYELISIEGECGYCLNNPTKVLTQIGVERFGVKMGACLDCVTTLIKDEPSLKIAVGFKDSTDQHIINVDSEKIENFLHNPKNLTGLSKEEIANLTGSVKLHLANPKLAQAREYKKRPYQCKKCSGYVFKVIENKSGDPFSSLCGMRNTSNYLVSCFGCSTWLARKDGCSMLTCQDKLCANQICAFCLNGASTASDLVHDIAACSKKILNKEEPPKPRLCNCKNAEECV